MTGFLSWDEEMVFSSLVFLCVFLPLVLLFYVICPKRYKNLWLMLSSLFFYAWGEPSYVLIMLFSTAFDYTNGRLLEYFDEKEMEQTLRKKCRKGILILSIVGNLGILFVFKYLDLLLSTWNQITSMNIKLLELPLPIGISFYTFQTMSYTIDVYKHEVKAQHNLISFGMYVSMFPQLIAGPIIRYRIVEQKITDRQILPQTWAEGMQRFLMGLGKKVLFANQIGVLWDDISASSSNELSMAGAWLGAFAYTFQIYFDFSGYSDMAIGLGKMFGFYFPENFRHPYECESITEFWRRWHISLSGWFRDYVYIPLGGNRKGTLRQFFNMLSVWFLTGFWHGASWNFVLWGLYYFVLLAFEKWVLLQELKTWPHILRHLYTKFFIVIGWMLFANEDFGKMGTYLKTMFGLQGSFVNSTAIYQWRTHLVFLLILSISATTFPKHFWQNLKQRVWGEETQERFIAGEIIERIAYGVYTILVLFFSLGMLVGGSYNPFLYFRF